MGQKSSLITLRKSNIFQYSSIFSQTFYYYYSFFNLFKYLCFKYKIFLVHYSFFFFENKIFLTFYMFFRVAFFLKFINLEKKKIFKKRVQKKINLKSLFSSFFLLNKNCIIYTVKYLNLFLKKKKKLISIFFLEFKKNLSKLFPRRFKFFLDFLQISILFVMNKVSVAFYVLILVEIFKFLQKKTHAKFFNFITKFFNFILYDSRLKPFKKKFNLLGIKLLINGKLKGKSRATNFLYLGGSVPIQTLKANIEFSKAPVFTIYGVYGLKIWAYRQI